MHARQHSAATNFKMERITLYALISQKLNLIGNMIGAKWGRYSDYLLWSHLVCGKAIPLEK
jgi:hypothetical protein